MSGDKTVHLSSYYLQIQASVLVPTKASPQNKTRSKSHIVVFKLRKQRIKCRLQWPFQGQMTWLTYSLESWTGWDGMAQTWRADAPLQPLNALQQVLHGQA